MSTVLTARPRSTGPRYMILCVAAALLAVMASGARAASPIDPERMAQYVKALSTDEYQGRSPGTEGEDKTVSYLIERFKSLGLEPGGRRSSWTFPVQLLHTRIEDGGSIAVMQGRQESVLAIRSDVYVTTVRPVDHIAIRNAPLVFVGYGVYAPERQWDDFKGVDLKGKVAIFLVNDPDFEALPTEAVYNRFGGRRMTYYGRWTYKFEEASRRGAIAALVVHDTPGAGYPWSTVIASGSEAYDVVRKDPTERVLLQGWLEGGAAAALFKRAGLDLASLRVQARQPDFHPIELPDTTLDASLSSSHAVVESHNVLAKITGSRYPQEVVMFGAHWDAFGTGPADAQGRTVRHGANDDAVGVAGVLELAKAMTRGTRPQRTLVFGLWTAEERGLLGSESYALDPIYPLSTTVADMTVDTLQTAGPAHDIILVGKGQNGLEDLLAAAAKAQGRTVTPEPLPERGFFYRADHFPFAKRGVPTLLLMGGIAGAPDLVNGGKAAGDIWHKAYMACYHQPCDVWDSTWDLRGAADDISLIYTIGEQLANSRLWPSWSTDSEFRAIRETSGSQRVSR
jgi:Zn-dependent M28 family amino/carboxypeptidase